MSQLDVIKFLRFPLIIGIVLIHTSLCPKDIAFEQGYYMIGNISSIFSNIIPSFCVPMFFAFSGFLFFYNIKDLTIKEYLRKLHRRIYSLLIPYLFWNILVVIYYLLINQLLGKYEDLTTFSITDWIDVFYSKFGGFPIAFQLWYLRDLIILSIISPIIFYAVKYLKHVYLTILLILVLSQELSLVKEIPLFYFSLGALFSIHKINFTNISTSLLFIASITGIICFVIKVSDCMNNPIINILYVISMFIIMVAFAKQMLRKGFATKINELSKTSFFIYAFHGFPIAIVSSGIYQIISNIPIPILSKDVLFSITYFPIAIGIIAIGITLFRFFIKYFPKFTSIIVGGRQ